MIKILRMRVVFLGSPEEVVPVLQSLERLAADGACALVGVVSQPARPMGRGSVVQDPPVAAYAKSKGIPTWQPAKASEAQFLSELALAAPDICVTAAYGQILSTAFLQIPKRATINIHPSLLPRHRGATPVPAAFLSGDADSGVTVLFTVKELDAGAIILQESSPIAPEETAVTLMRRLFVQGGDMLGPALRLLADPSFVGTPQDLTAVTHCRKIDKTDGLVNWNDSAEMIIRRFRAYDPWPGTYTMWRGARVSFEDVQSSAEERRDAPGIFSFDKASQALLVTTGKGVVAVKQLKPAGGKSQPAAAFWNGIKDRSLLQFGSI